MAEETIRFNWYETIARQKLGMPPEWRMSRWEAHGQLEDPMIEVQGGVYPPIARGPNKGKPNWRKPVLGTKLATWISPAEERAFKQKWQEQSGKCWVCYGTGEQWAGWHHQEGHSYKPCRTCCATGKPPAQETA